MFYWILSKSAQRWVLVAALSGLATLVFFAAAASAQPRHSGIEVLDLSLPRSCLGDACLALPPPADTGKPVIPDMIRHGRSGCAGAPCRVEIIGAAPGRGAIELRATAFKW